MATAIPELSRGYIADYVAKWVLPPPGAIFQVLGTKQIAGDESNVKHRLCLSDGVHRFSQSILQLADVDTPVPSVNSIIKMKADGEKPNTIFKMSDKLIWIVRDFEVVAQGGTDVTERIGNPSTLNPSNILSGPQAAENALPATPSPSHRATVENGSSAPGVPVKRPFGAPGRDDSEDRSKLPRRALFTDGANGTCQTRATQAIKTLTPYNNKYLILAKVTKKSDLREWNNSRNSGKVFDVILQDASGEIKASGFNEAAVKFSQIFQLNKLYYVSQAQIKNSNPNFNPTKHPYELSFHQNTEVTEARGDSISEDIPDLTYDYVRIIDIAQKDDKELIDVIGICSGINDVIDITSKKSGRQMKKRDVQLMDTSDTQISVTLWSKQAEEFGNTGAVGKVVRIRRAQVSDFNGKSLSVSFNSILELDPNSCPEANVLLDWWSKRSEDSASLNNLSRSTMGMSSAVVNKFSTLQEIQTEFKEVSASDPARSHKFEAYVVDIKTDTVMYPACAKCNKKVIDQSNGSYRCEKCATSTAEFNWRYILRAAIADATEYQWVTLFDDTAEKVVGIKAKDLRALSDQDHELFRAKLHEAKFNLFEFISRTKCETYNDENRIKMTINQATPVSMHSNKDRVARLKEEIAQMKSELI